MRNSLIISNPNDAPCSLALFTKLPKFKQIFLIKASLSRALEVAI